MLFIAFLNKLRIGICNAEFVLYHLASHFKLAMMSSCLLCVCVCVRHSLFCCEPKIILLLLKIQLFNDTNQHVEFLLKFRWNFHVTKIVKDFIRLFIDVYDMATFSFYPIDKEGSSTISYSVPCNDVAKKL